MLFRFARWLVSVLCAAAVIHLGFMLWERNRPQGRIGPAVAGVPNELTASSLKILHFYASPASINTEEEATLCYGVLNALSVQLDPPVAEIKPSINRCIAVAPRAVTTFTLIARAASGEEARASFTLPVTPAPPRFLFASTSERTIRAGEPFTVCYGVRNATGVCLDPVTQHLPSVPRNCYRFYPGADTRFALTASGPGGHTRALRFSVKVKK